MDVLDAIADPRFPRPMSRAAWDRLVEIDALADARVELIRGVVVRMSPVTDLHIDVTDWLTNMLTHQLGISYRVSAAGAIAAADESEPQPDVMVRLANWTKRERPTDALLVIEVAVSSLRYDLGTKADLYAETGIAEYWVVDAERSEVHVHTQPDRAARRYASVAVLRDGDVLRPTLLAPVELAVSGLPR